MAGICGEAAHHALVINARAAPAIARACGVPRPGWMVSKANTWETCKRGIDRDARHRTTRLGRLDTTTRHQTPPAPAPRPPQTVPSSYMAIRSSHDCQCHVVHHVPVCALCPASAPGPCGLRVGGGHWCMWTLDCAWAAYLLTTLLDCPPLGLAASQLRHRHRPRKRSLAVGQTLGSTREDARMPCHILPLISPGVVPLRVSRPAAPSRARPCVFSGSRGTAAAPCGTRRSRPRTSSPSGS